MPLLVKETGNAASESKGQQRGTAWFYTGHKRVVAGSRQPGGGGGGGVILQHPPHLLHSKGSRMEGLQCNKLAIAPSGLFLLAPTLSSREDKQEEAGKIRRS